MSGFSLTSGGKINCKIFPKPELHRKRHISAKISDSSDFVFANYGKVAKNARTK